MNLIKLVIILGLGVPALAQSAPQSPSTQPATKLESVPAPTPAQPAKPTLQLTQKEQLELKLQFVKFQEKELNKRLKEAKKQEKETSGINKEIQKIRENHGWGNDVRIVDQGSQIVGVKE